MAAFQDLWQKACNEAAPDPAGAAGELIAALAALLKVEQIEYAKLEGAAVFLLDLSSLGFCKMSLNVLMIAHPPSTALQARQQVELLQEYKHAVHSVGFCFLLFLAESRLPQYSEIPEFLDAVLLSGSDLRRLFASHAIEGVFFELLRSQVSLEELNPFNTTHEARGAMFRGRRSELHQIVSQLDTNFAVSGARRIGKTSLLRRAYDALRTQKAHRDRTFYFNCINWGNFWDCCDRLAHQIDPRREMRIEKGAKNIVYMLERRSFKGSRPLLLFFDEIDRVIENDETSQWQFFRIISEAMSERWIRIAIAGYRSIALLALGMRQGSRQISARSDTPLLDALVTITLKPLSRSETQALFADPFKSVHITIRPEDGVLDRIWKGTGGYPYVVQFYGERLFQAASQRSPHEVLLLQDVDDFENSFEIDDFLLTHFLENTVDSRGPVSLERVCAFLLAHARGTLSWTEGQFSEACRQHHGVVDPGILHEALRNLIHAQVLVYSAGLFSFGLPRLRLVLHRSYPDLKALLFATYR